jgi:acetone carboxylase gamma subunit
MMNDVRSWSATLISMSGASGRVIACRACSTQLCSTDAVWKEHAVLREFPLKDAAGATYRNAGDDVLLRRFYCGSCGAALDSEIALPSEPFLLDRLEE